MKHLKRGRKFGRERNQRRALFRNLSHALIMRERIMTTEAKAKELRPKIEKLLTAAKAGTLASRRLLAEQLPTDSAKKMATILAPRFQERPGGYVRIIKMAPRKSDSAKRALIEFIS